MELKLFSKFYLIKKLFFEFVPITLICSLLCFCPFVVPSVFVYCLFLSENYIIRILSLFYLSWIIIDRDAGNNGGRGFGWKWLRKMCRGEAASNYFSINLVKTADLTPDKNYLFTVFPHGILSFGVILNFVPLSSKFWTLYPGIRPKVLTLNSLLCMPLIREFLMGLGVAAASQKSIQILLSQSNDPNDPVNSDGFTSNAAILVVGGVREVIFSQVGEYRLIAKSRKGYIKQAILAGRPLVPVFSFGEVDLYNQPANPPGSLIRKWQEITKRLFGFPMIYIRGALNVIPLRRPVTTVVGSPIEVKKCDNPSEEYINEVHEKFLNALTNLFETHKSKYIENYENVELILE